MPFVLAVFLILSKSWIKVGIVMGSLNCPHKGMNTFRWSSSQQATGENMVSENKVLVPYS